MADIPIKPSHPERVCWGCDQFCRADDLCCGNGTIRTPHPIELLGPDWQEWVQSVRGSATAPDPSSNAKHLPVLPALRERILRALTKVEDPELGVNVVDLGLVHSLRIDGSQVRIELLVTTPACPLAEYIAVDAEQRIAELADVTSVEVKPVWTPTWTPKRATPAVRHALGI